MGLFVMYTLAYHTSNWVETSKLLLWVHRGKFCLYVVGIIDIRKMAWRCRFIKINGCYKFCSRTRERCQVSIVYLMKILWTVLTFYDVYAPGNRTGPFVNNNLYNLIKLLNKLYSMDSEFRTVTMAPMR